jgi:hypothetical protein
MTCTGLITLLVLPIGQAPEVDGRTSMATTLMVMGDVRVASPGGQPRGLFVSAKLAANDRIIVNPGGETVVLFYRTGTRERLRPIKDGRAVNASTIVVGRDGCEPNKGVEVLERRDVRIINNLDKVPPLIRSGGVGVFIPRNGAGRDEATYPDVVPARQSAVLTGRPVFSWPRHERAARYRVRVLDATGRPLWTSLTVATSLPYPEHQKPLSFSQRYTWDVVALTDGAAEIPVVDGSPFHTVAKRLRAALEAVTALARGTDPADLALAAQMFLYYEAYAEALPLFQQLERVMPNDPAVQAGLAVCYHRLGKEALACIATCRAKELFARLESVGTSR